MRALRLRFIRSEYTMRSGLEFIIYVGGILLNVLVCLTTVKQLCLLYALMFKNKVVLHVFL